MKTCVSCGAQVPDGALRCGKCHSAKLESEDIDLEKPIVLPHLNLIEDPSLANKPVAVEGVVASTSISYLVPKRIEWSYEHKGELKTGEEVIDEKNPANIKLIGCSEETKYKRIKQIVGTSHTLTYNVPSYRTVYRLRVRPPVFTLEKRGEKIVDERGFEYKAHDIYVTSDESITFEASTLVRLEGIPLPNPKTQKTTLLVYKVEFPERIETFDHERLMVLKEKFAQWPVRRRKEWILENFERYSQIVKRRNLAEAGFLDFFTPIWVRFNGDIQKGWGNVDLIGDTTTAKTETMRKLIMLLKAGTLITGELASIVGLVGTVTQIEREGWFIEWGLLVLCDRKLLAIDGSHKLSPYHWAAIGESERTGVVMLTKAAKNSAYARTRLVKISNPVDRDLGRYSTKTLRHFRYPCQALPTTLDKTSIARLDLAVFSDSHDVKPEEVNIRFKSNYDPDLEILAEALKWVWSDRTQVVFTEDAVDKILSESTRLHRMFSCEMVPLVSIDIKWKLARLATSLAYLTLSTEDFETVTVRREHVDEVCRFLENEYAMASLNVLAQETKFEVVTEEDVQLIIVKVVNATKGGITEDEVAAIFRFIAVQGRITKDQLKTKFSLSDNNELRPLLAVLSNEGLIKQGRGFYPTPKLIQIDKIVATLTRLTPLTPPQREGSIITGQETLNSAPSSPDHGKRVKRDKPDGGESSPDLGKHGKLGKRQGPPSSIGLMAESCQFWHTKKCSAGVPSAISPTHNCPETCTNYQPKQEGPD